MQDMMKISQRINNLTARHGIKTIARRQHCKESCSCSANTWTTVDSRQVLMKSQIQAANRMTVDGQLTKLKDLY